MDTAPRPYSTLRDGKIVWVTPEEHQGVKKRSRLETDSEVRMRLREAIKTSGSAWGWYFPPDVRYYTGKGLDLLLKDYGLEPRKFVDEEP